MVVVYADACEGFREMVATVPGARDRWGDGRERSGILGFSHSTTKGSNFCTMNTM